MTSDTLDRPTVLRFGVLTSIHSSYNLFLEHRLGKRLGIQVEGQVLEYHPTRWYAYYIRYHPAGRKEYAVALTTKYYLGKKPPTPLPTGTYIGVLLRSRLIEYYAPCPEGTCVQSSPFQYAGLTLGHQSRWRFLVADAFASFSGQYAPFTPAPFHLNLGAEHFPRFNARIGISVGLAL